MYFCPEAEVHGPWCVLIPLRHNLDEALLGEACHKRYPDVVVVGCSLQSDVVAPGTIPAWGRGGSAEPSEQAPAELGGCICEHAWQRRVWAAMTASCACCQQRLSKKVSPCLCHLLAQQLCTVASPAHIFDEMLVVPHGKWSIELWVLLQLGHNGHSHTMMLLWGAVELV